MCLIAIKPRGVKVTEAWYKSIEKGFASNGDGAGFSIKQFTSEKNNRVCGYDLHKGTKEDNFTLDYMMSLIQDTYKLSDEDEIMCHFRIKTAGKINQQNCHPFIMDPKDVDEVEGWHHDYPVLAHNGGFSINALYSGMSDTYTFVRDFSSNKHNMDMLYKEGEKFFTKDFTKLDSINNVDFEKIGVNWNKIGIMFPEADRDIITIGDFVKDPDTGCLYSHSGYKSSFHRDYGGSSFNGLGNRMVANSSLSVVKSDPDYKVSNRKPFSMNLSEEYLKEIEEYKEAKKKADDEEASRKKHLASYQKNQQKTSQGLTDTRDTGEWTRTLKITNENRTHVKLKVKENFDLFDEGDMLVIENYDEVRDEYRVKWESTAGVMMANITVSRSDLVQNTAIVIRPEFRDFYNEYFRLCALISRTSKNLRKKLSRKLEECNYKRKMFINLRGFDNNEIHDVNAFRLAYNKVIQLEVDSKMKAVQQCLVN